MNDEYETPRVDQENDQEMGNDAALEEQGVTEEQVAAPVEEDDAHRRAEEELVDRQTAEPDDVSITEEPPVAPDFTPEHPAE